jgi:lipoprotein-anchoring transpeptidase ErfK/SrfK
MAGDRSGWIALRGLELAHTTVSVEADVSAHQIVVRRGDDVLFRAPAATGAPATPTPTGSYFVTDRVSFPGGGALGTFAFGLSGIQPNLPVGWSGGDQLAIHGTDAPSTIGTSASAGCLRVSEATLSRLEPLLRLGTPVVIHG